MRYLVTVEQCFDHCDLAPCSRVDVADTHGRVFAREHYPNDDDAERRAAAVRGNAREIERLHVDYLDPAREFAGGL